jgi:hypothetical protein
MLLGSKAPLNGLKAQELLETESILRQAASFCRTAKKMGWHLASPICL